MLEILLLLLYKIFDCKEIDKTTLSNHFVKNFITMKESLFNTSDSISNIILKIIPKLSSNEKIISSMDDFPIAEYLLNTGLNKPEVLVSYKQNNKLFLCFFNVFLNLKSFFYLILLMKIFLHKFKIKM